MHGIFICINNKYAIVACPGCDHLHAFHGPLRTTLCPECIHNSAIVASLKPLLAQTTIIFPPTEPHPEATFFSTLSSRKRFRIPPQPKTHCFIDNRVIKREPMRQLIVDPSIPALFALPVCPFHHSETILVTTDYTTAANRSLLSS